jgi:hypothetical protein
MRPPCRLCTQVGLPIKWRANVWCGIVGCDVVWPHVIGRLLTGCMCLDSLQRHCPLFSICTIWILSDLWFHRHGLSHTLCTRQALHEYFPESWIWNLRRVRWPSRSPYLIQLGCFLLGTSEWSLPTVINHREDMQQNTVDAYAAMLLRTLQYVHNSLNQECLTRTDASRQHYRTSARK